MLPQVNKPLRRTACRTDLAGLHTSQCVWLHAHVPNEFRFPHFLRTDRREERERREARKDKRDMARREGAQYSVPLQQLRYIARSFPRISRGAPLIHILYCRCRSCVHVAELCHVAWSESYIFRASLYHVSWPSPRRRLTGEQVVPISLQQLTTALCFTSRVTSFCDSRVVYSLRLTRGLH